ADQSVAAAFDHHTGKPTGNAADNQPNDECLCVHVSPHFCLPGKEPCSHSFFITDSSPSRAAEAPCISSVMGLTKNLAALSATEAAGKWRAGVVRTKPEAFPTRLCTVSTFDRCGDSCHVRFGSEADMTAFPIDVRFTPPEADIHQRQRPVERLAMMSTTSSV